MYHLLTLRLVAPVTIVQVYFEQINTHSKSPKYCNENDSLSKLFKKPTCLAKECDNRTTPTHPKFSCA